LRDAGGSTERTPFNVLQSSNQSPTLLTRWLGDSRLTIISVPQAAVYMGRWCSSCIFPHDVQRYQLHVDSSTQEKEPELTGKKHRDQQPSSRLHTATHQQRILQGSQRAQHHSRRQRWLCLLSFNMRSAVVFRTDQAVTLDVAAAQGLESLRRQTPADLLSSIAYPTS
jgi:hypothetical protein